MKTKLAFLIGVILAGLSGCIIGPFPSPAISAEPDETLPPEPPVYYATVEYGEPDAVIDNADFLQAYIRFPNAGAAIDKPIEDWANETYQSAKAEVDALRQTDSAAGGEINIHFDSYLIDGRYVGIVEDGMFITTHMANARSIVRTFNIDLLRGVYLESTDLLDASKYEDVLPLLRKAILAECPDAADYLGHMDSGWLNSLVIAHGGIIVLLERGEYLPGYFGTLRILLPNADLADALLLGQAATPAPTLEPTPVPSPEPPTVTSLPPAEIDPSKPMIALTFDDGPSQYTSRILDTLEQYGARATFCHVGNLINARKETVLRAFNMGCEIIGHSWDHRNLTKLSESEIRKEILDTYNAIEAITGDAPQLYRPPYGSVNDTVKAVSRELGFAMITWSVDPEDWKTKNADAVYSAVMSHIKNKAIVLSHDLYRTTAEAYERIFPELIAQGYQLVTVSELLSYTYDTLKPGAVYSKGK